MPKPTVQVHEGHCGSWWNSLAHFDYLHRCTEAVDHDGKCRCECGVFPGPGGVAFPRTREIGSHS